MAAAKPTCLFTGVPLELKTKEEHTIQRAVGGRIVSRRVSSDIFNETAGRRLDDGFAKMYAPIFNRIGLLTPSGHKAPKIPATINEDDGFEFRPGGLLTRRGIAVEFDPITHKLKSATAGDPEAIQKLIAKHGGSWTLTAEPATAERIATFESGCFEFNTEMAALKSILLTFDERLHDDPRRFTRHPGLAKVREYVRGVVMDGKRGGPAYEHFSMGLQYDKLMELKRIRSRIPIAETPFEHLMVASGNPSTKTVDAVWVMAGIDPYGFRLCDEWLAYPFTCVLVSGVLKGTATTHDWSETEFNCRPQPHRRTVRRASMQLPAPEHTVREIACHHKDALHRAIDLVERNCPKFVTDCIAREARLGFAGKTGGRIVDAVLRRLEMMFDRRLADPEKRAAFDEIVNRHKAILDQAMLAEEVTSCTRVPKNLSWNRWFLFQNGILDDLRHVIGLPGDIGTPEIEVELTRVKGFFSPGLANSIKE